MFETQLFPFANVLAYLTMKVGFVVLLGGFPALYFVTPLEFPLQAGKP